MAKNQPRLFGEIGESTMYMLFEKFLVVYEIYLKIKKGDAGDSFILYYYIGPLGNIL